MRDSAVKRWSALHTVIYRATGGIVGRRLVDNDMLLLTTRGHRTGDQHTVPLLYLRGGRCLVVVASYGGRDHNPTWYENLSRNPKVVVQLGSRRVAMTARTAEPGERTVWWPRVVAAYDGYTVYQSRTDRQIPIVFLEPPDESENQAG
jgi:deazaflavin-dependent oxidoreductase (nitroreductase family)